MYNQTQERSQAKLGSSAFADIKNLEALANQYFNNVCHENGREDNCFEWVDLNGQKDPHSPFRKVEVVDVSKLRYSIVQEVSKPSLVLSQDYCNSLKHMGSFSFKKSSSSSSECSWSVTSGISL